MGGALGGNPLLAIEEDGIHAAEALLLARYFMFTQVYFHPVRRAYDHHLGEALRGILPQGKYPEPSNLDTYLQWDDLRVLGSVRELAADGSLAGEHARRVVERDHYRDAYHTHEHPSLPQLGRWEELCSRVREEYGDAVAFDSAEKAPYRFNRPAGFPVVKEGDSRPTSIEEESALIDKLQELRIRRILAPKEKSDEVAAFCENQNQNVR